MMCRGVMIDESRRNRFLAASSTDGHSKATVRSSRSMTASHPRTFFHPVYVHAYVFLT